LLLTGPPGTGKTTVARVLAAETRCSFYPLSASDITSKWLGESEDNVRRIFERARDNRPSIVFVDEIDAVAGKRGTGWTYEPLVNELLRQIDGMDSNAGVFVVGATNRADQLDPALLRGGRLSRVIEIPLPDAAGRAKLLALFTAKMPLDGVDVALLAQQCDGLSGADLQALCQQAAVEALTRADERDEEPSVVLAGDFARALAAHRANAAMTPPAHRVKAREGYL
jgi:transitional endoplasmic reticulum ATPase